MEDLIHTLPAAIRAAELRIRPFVRETPLQQSLALSQAGGGQVWLKLENWQHTGSFKVRGAMNKLLSLAPAEQARGIVTASSGNHGAAVAFGLAELDLRGIVFVPTTASPVKVESIRRLGAEVRFHGDDTVVTELYARTFAAEQGMTFVSPYNDPAVVAGQGTIGVEMARQQPALEAIFVTVGGGGLAGGIAAYWKAVHPQVRLVGCLPANSPVMAASVQAGAIVEMESLPTLADGSAGGIEPGAITFPLCAALIDEFVLVSEAEIAAALRGIVAQEHMLVEGAAAAAVAAYQQQAHRFAGQRVAIVLCGANISPETLKSVL